MKTTQTIIYTMPLTNWIGDIHNNPNNLPQVAIKHAAFSLDEAACDFQEEIGTKCGIMLRLDEIEVETMPQEQEADSWQAEVKFKITFPIDTQDLNDSFPFERC